MKKKNVDIILTVHNTDKYLASCLKSIEKQNYKNIHLIIINDGSKDNSQSIINEFINSSVLNIDEKINQVAMGVSTARNIGLSLAKGPYVTFMDSDDVIQKNHISVLIETLEKTHTDMAITGAIKVKKIEYHEVNDFKIKRFNYHQTMKNILGFKNIQGYSVNKLYKLDKIKTWNIKFDRNLFVCEDLDFVCTYMACCKASVGFSGINTYIYRDNSNSVLSQRISKNDIIKKGVNEQEAYAKIGKIINDKLSQNYYNQKFTWITTNFVRSILELDYDYLISSGLMSKFQKMVHKNYWIMIFENFLPLKDTIHFIVNVFYIKHYKNME